MNDLAPYWFDGVHVLIAGTTGSGERYGGKTATAHYWTTLGVREGPFEYAVAFDPKGGDNYAFTSVSGPQEAAEAVASGSRYISWSPPRNDLESEHATALAFARGLDGRVIMVHDDAVMYRNAESLKEATALAGNPAGGGGIKSLVATQDPWDLPRQGVRANLPVKVWVGPVTDEAMSWFQQVKTGETGRLIKERHADRPHAFSVMNGDDVDTYDAVPAAFA